MLLTRRSAADLLADLANGEIGAAELMQATLNRIQSVNGAVNAIVGLRDSDDLMAQARAMDSGPIRGPLHGLPIAVKDLVNVQGVVSTHGSPAFSDVVPDADDLIAARLRAAGAILIGKTNVPEFGLGSHTFNPVYGATRNPYDSSFTAGGSSGGAAVALATGMTALADGSDMMGSLRNPAAWNNVYGFRPSWGRIPGGIGGETFLHRLATLGPMARSPEDIAILLDVMSGPDPRLPYGAPTEPVAPLKADAGNGTRVGWLGDWGGALPMEEGILEICEAGLAVFQSLGCEVDTLLPPFSADEMWQSWITLRSWEVSTSPKIQSADRSLLKESAIWEVDRGRAMSAHDVHAASLVRSEWFHTAAELFDTYDVLVLPSAQVWPFDIDLAHPTKIAGQEMDTYHRWMQVVVPVSLIGLPSLAVPTGFGAAGLPMGIQIFGRRGSDANLLALGAAYHAATGWPQKRPAL